jgi:uncharacterized protein (DUF2384 family)
MPFLSAEKQTQFKAKGNSYNTEDRRQETEEQASWL